VGLEVTTKEKVRSVLVAAQRLKLIVGSSLLAILALLLLFPNFWSALIGVNVWKFSVSVLLVFVVLLCWLIHIVRCPNCGQNLFLHAIGHDKYGNWLGWLLNHPECPKCGYRKEG